MTQTIPPGTVALTRRRYAEGATIRSIKAETGLKSLEDIYRCLDGELDDGSGMPLPALPRRRPGLARAQSPGRNRLVQRLWKVAEKQVRQIEQRLELSPDEPDERGARMTAVLLRTVRELSAFDQKQQGQAPGGADVTAHGDSVPRDIDELRASIARKLEALLAGSEEDVAHSP